LRGRRATLVFSLSDVPEWVDTEQERAEWDAVRDALRTAGIDPSDLGRFVNRPNPDLRGLEPETFDATAAHPVLLEWLPRVRAANLKQTIATRLAQGGRDGETAVALLAEYRRSVDEILQWTLGDAISRVATPAQYDEIVELAARGGRGSQMLVFMLWRIKTQRSHDVMLAAIRDPDVCVHAMSSLRRALGNREARSHIERLVDDASPHVREVAAQTLKKIDKALSR
jgi:HEAT repeat protein